MPAGSRPRGGSTSLPNSANGGWSGPPRVVRGGRKPPRASSCGSHYRPRPSASLSRAARIMEAMDYVPHYLRASPLLTGRKPTPSARGSTPRPCALHTLDVQVLCLVFSSVEDFPRLASVCRGWKAVCESDACYQSVVYRLAEAAAGGWQPQARHPSPVSSLESYGVSTWKALWEAKHFHVRWRKSPANLMVDFPTSVINNLTNDESALSQIYYTYPRVGLQFKRKFALYAVETCHDLHRIALKKGVHLRTDPSLEDAEYLCTGWVEDTIIKLDFTTSTYLVGQDGEERCDWQGAAQRRAVERTNVVVWTAGGIDLITFERPESYARLTAEEKKRIYAMNPLQSSAKLQLKGHSLADVLVVHINASNVISLLCTNGAVHFYSFATASHMFSTMVPGPLVAPGCETAKWKSRERFDFKGSSSIGAVIDARGLVHAFVFEKRSWLTVQARYMETFMEGVAAAPARHGSAAVAGAQGEVPLLRAPKPRYVRAAGHCIVFWNGLASTPNMPPPADWDPLTAPQVSDAAVSSGGPPPYYIEAWKCANVHGEVKPRRMICECYAASSSVHIDELRMYVSASIERKDVFVDVWCLATGAFISRIHAVNNSWSLEKEHLRTHLSKLFWSTNGTLLYYELNTRHDNTNTLCFRQLSSVPQADYWDACVQLKGDTVLNREEHKILSSQPVRRSMRHVWPHLPGASSDTVMVNAFEKGIADES